MCQKSVLFADDCGGDAMRLNWAAVLVAAIVHWLLGAVWFTLFANRWMAGLRMAPEELEARNQEIPRDRDIILYCT